MTLRTMTPDGDFDTDGGAVDSLATLGDEDRVLVWCDDGCGDCQRLLPAFAGALEAADVPDEQVVQHAVERLPEGRKGGPGVEQYGIERIPTVVVERNGVEIARFVEGDAGAIAESIAPQLDTAE